MRFRRALASGLLILVFAGAAQAGGVARPVLPAGRDPQLRIGIRSSLVYDSTTILSQLESDHPDEGVNLSSGGDPPEMRRWNKGLRFALELGAVGAMGWWGYEQADGGGRYALMVGVPLVAAATWGIFAVPSDPSRGQDGLVRVSGLTRLLIEAAFFGFATWALHDLGEDPLAVGYGSVVVVHYAVSFDRVKWLIKQ